VIFVKATDIVLYLEDGDTIVIPSSYGLIHDESGEQLERCSLFIGPFDDAGPFDGELTGAAADYFGTDYKARLAEFDVPDGTWDSVGQVAEILYYRPGAYEDDWKHSFSSPVPLYALGPWYRIALPSDCKVNWRGIVRP
jgi:hypothetical protein